MELVKPFARALLRLAQQPETPQENLSDALLAERILSDAPYYLYGPHELHEHWPDATHRYANGAWALMAMGREDEAWELFAPLRRVGQSMLDAGGPISISTPTLLVFIYLAQRRGETANVQLGLNLIHKRPMNPQLREDIDMLSRAA